MSAVIANIPVFLAGIQYTVALVAVSSILSVALGCAFAAMRISPIPPMRTTAYIYVEVIRNTPITIIFFFCAFVLPKFGVTLPYFTFAIMALVLYYAAFFSEAIRSGFNSIPVGQAEAARAIGLTFTKSLRYVVFPQAFRFVIPPLINVFIALIKSTAVASAFGVPELLTMTEQLANSESNAVLSILAASALIYLLMTIPAGFVSAHFERKVAKTQ